MEERIYKPGEHIGNYQVIEHLASGAFSAIYKVHDMEDAPDAGASALKTCRFDRNFLTEEAQLDYNRRLDREFRLIANLNHQGVVAALESRYHDGLGYYAMELLEGPTLGRFLTEARRPFAVLLDLFQQLTETLAYCHRQGVVHRDLHPWNILLSTRDKRRMLSEQESGEEGNYEEGSTLSEQGRLGRQGVIRTPYVPVILDFGISHDLSALPITAPRQIVGAPLYLTPDYARAILEHGLKRPHSAEPSEDVFILGVLLYGMLTGQLPTLTPAEHFVDLLTEIRDQPPVHPRERNPDAPPAFAELAMLCLQKHRGQRPAEGTDLLWRANVALQEDAPYLQKLAPEYRGRGGGTPGGDDSGSATVCTSLPIQVPPEVLAKLALPAQVPASPSPAPAVTAPVPPASPVVDTGAVPAQRTTAPPHWLLAAAVGGLAAEGLALLVIVTGLLLGGFSLSRTHEDARGPASAEQPAQGGSPATGQPMPSSPLKGQARPRCPYPLNKVINGGCWVGPFEDETPPCSKGHFSHEGGCYMAQVEPPKPEPSTEKRLDGGQ